jgi:hypothetical protein
MVLVHDESPLEASKIGVSNTIKKQIISHHYS